MSEPHARSRDDKKNLGDLKDVADAVEFALAALKSAMVGGPPRNREQFIFKIGFARGRLSRISSRITGEHVAPLPESDGESDP